MFHSKTYLGDAVYADFDGIHIILTTEDGISTTNTIFLEPAVLEALNRYADRLRQLAHENHQNEQQRSTDSNSA